MVASESKTTNSDAKLSLRQGARVKRRALHSQSGDAGNRICEHFIDRFGLEPRCVTGYWPTGSEVDVMPLLRQLDAAGWSVGLPAIVEADQPLGFVAWHPDASMKEGPHGIMTPDIEDGAAIVPDIMLVPLLAFDASGHRLGQGGGYYDRTLEVLRKSTDFLAVGVAYGGQRVDALPVDGHDEILDMVITDVQLFEFNKR